MHYRWHLCCFSSACWTAIRATTSRSVELRFRVDISGGVGSHRKNLNDLSNVDRMDPYQVSLYKIRDMSELMLISLPHRRRAGAILRTKLHLGRANHGLLETHAIRLASCDLCEDYENSSRDN